MTRHDREGDAIRLALGELRAADEGQAPSFESVLTRRTSPGLSFRPLALAAALVLAIGLTYAALRPEPQRLVVPAEVLALSAGHPLTDALLPRSTQTRAPSLGASLVDSTLTGDLP